MSNCPHVKLTGVSITCKCGQELVAPGELQALRKVAEAARYMHRFCTNAYSDYEGDLILQYESAVKALDALKKGEAP